MAQVTIRLLDGADRGRVYDELDPPVTIGREEGNTIQLNDERVSRFHVKIQEDNNKLVLTDLESTNGTKVNGEDIQLRILRFGDLVMIGRSVLLFGSREEIAGRLAELRKNGGSHHGTRPKLESSEDEDEASLDYELNWANDPDLQATLHMFEPPELPERLSPAQAAQLSELLEYVHIRIRHLISTVATEESSQQFELPIRQWQDLIDLQARLASYLRSIGEPEKE